MVIINFFPPLCDNDEIHLFFSTYFSYLIKLFHFISFHLFFYDVQIKLEKRTITSCFEFCSLYIEYSKYLKYFSTLKDALLMIAQNRLYLLIFFQKCKIFMPNNNNYNQYLISVALLTHEYMILLTVINNF